MRETHIECEDLLPWREHVTQRLVAERHQSGDDLPFARQTHSFAFAFTQQHFQRVTLSIGTCRTESWTHDALECACRQQEHGQQHLDQLQQRQQVRRQRHGPALADGAWNRDTDDQDAQRHHRQPCQERCRCTAHRQREQCTAGDDDRRGTGTSCKLQALRLLQVSLGQLRAAQALLHPMAQPDAAHRAHGIGCERHGRHAGGDEEHKRKRSHQCSSTSARSVTGSVRSKYTRNTCRRRTCSTTTRKPAMCSSSPARGTRPSRSMIRPPTVPTSSL